MTPAARVAAAIEIITDIETRHRPAADALKDWGLGHRFAGSKDRAALASLTYDALRCRSSAAWIMAAETPRAIILGSLREMRGLSVEQVAALCTGEGHAPAPLSDDERSRLETASLDTAPAHVRGDFPEWLAPSFAAVFGDAAVEEGRALATRAPLDLRVNTLKTTRDKAAAALHHLGAAPTPLSPLGLRLPLLEDGRSPSLAGEPAYVKGLVEIQDEGSQLAALFCAAQPGEQVLDLCAGGGGKTLALAAAMENRGQIYATDRDARRLAPLYQRLERAGTRNVQVRTPRRGSDILADLETRCDLVLIDAPCTGTGTWRRNPDAKWRVRPGALMQRMKEQDEVLESAQRFVKQNGRLIYVTCSLLRDENEDRIEAFLENHADFAAIGAAELAGAAGLPELAGFASRLGPGLRLSPLTSGTDGFFIAGVRRS
ncbi:MAG TPA: RsmB/NOP family class I SAM-dependent RNA methyltransferase [Methylovirgula sp.]|nr:RsmB/NOP family class I SAM-dependent RNA methyltransferase [Methylovirgula sp.]